MKKILESFKILRSFKLRIFIIIILVGMIPSAIMKIVILNNHIDVELEKRTSGMHSQAKIVVNQLINYNYLEDTTSEVMNAELNQLSTLYDGRILIVDQNFKIIKDTFDISQGKIMISEEVIKCFKGEEIIKHNPQEQYIEVVMPISMKEEVEKVNKGNKSKEASENLVRGVILFSVSTDQILTASEELQREAEMLGLIMNVIILALAVGIAIIILKPFDRVTEAISQVQEGYHDEITNVSDFLETEYIIEAFNQVLGKMNVVDESRKEFVSNVSHELKTPLTSMKVLADALLDQEEVPNELYREFMIDIADEIDRENKIINDLLSLVKMDKKVANLNIEEININTLMELILKRLRPIAVKQDVELVFESLRTVIAEVDEVKLTLAISNLIENGIKYNSDKGWVKVILDADHQFFTLEISDSGIGISEEAIEHIFERFYRVDKSHSREIGGTGIGLAITRSAIIVHKGSIRVSSVEEEGTTFYVKIPLSYIV